VIPNGFCSCASPLRVDGWLRTTTNFEDGFL
jgi:hypothetical protein